MSFALLHAPHHTKTAGSPHRTGEGLPDVLFSPLDLQILIRLNAGMTQVEIGADLRIEQPAISKLLRAAEARSGLDLVQQDGRRAVLTPVGRELAVAAQRAFGHLAGLDEFVASLRAGHAGRVRVLGSSTAASYVLPPIVGAFLALHPETHVDLEESSVETFGAKLAGGAFDLAVMPQTAFPPDVIAAPLYEDPVVFFAAPGAAIARRSELSWDDLRGETLVAKFVVDFWGQIVRDLQRRGFAWSNQIDLRTAEAVKQMVAAGLGVGMLFRSALTDEFADGTLVPLPLHDAALLQTHCIVQRRDATLTPVVRRFKDFACGRLRAGTHATRA
jgi:DNA-binding transcriptional LysR family regulator